MDPKMRQGSRLKALGDIKEMMAEGEAKRAEPMFAKQAPELPPEGDSMHEGMEPGAEMVTEGEGLPSDTDAPSELSPEDISKLKQLLELMQ